MAAVSIPPPLFYKGHDTMTQFSVEALRTALKKSGANNHMMAHALGVNRCSVSLWLHGHRQPHPMFMARIKVVLEAIDDAVTMGALPLSANVPAGDRCDEFKDVVTARLAAKGINLTV